MPITFHVCTISQVLLSYIQQTLHVYNYFVYATRISISLLFTPHFSLDSFVRLQLPRALQRFNSCRLLKTSVKASSTGICKL